MKLQKFLTRVLHGSDLSYLNPNKDGLREKIIKFPHASRNDR